MKPQDIVITRDNKLARIVRISREDGVDFAWIKYLDGSNPSGDGAIDPESGICEHRVKTGKVMSGTDYYNDDHWTTEQGLRRATPTNLRRAGLTLPTPTLSLTVHGPNLRGGPAQTFHVHTAECKDNGREVKRYGSDYPYTHDFASIQEVVEFIYSDQLREAEGEVEWYRTHGEPDRPDVTWGDYVHDFHFAPCVPKTFPQDTHPTPNTQEDSQMASKTTTTPKSTPKTTETVEEVKIDSKLLGEYLKDRVSKDPDAPHRGLPYITSDDVLRVRPTDWVEWLVSRDITPTKRQALAVLKDAGLVQKSTTLPALEGQPKGKAQGLYTGPAPRGTSRLPRYTPPAKVTTKTAKSEETTTEVETPTES